MTVSFPLVNKDGKAWADQPLRCFRTEDSMLRGSCILAIKFAEKGTLSVCI